MSQKAIRLERLAPGQHELYRTIRLAALKDSPEAFAATFEEASKRPDESWRSQAEALAQASDRTAFLAYEGNLPVGLMAFYGSETARGEVMQVWIAPRSRGTGLASLLLERLLKWARAQGYQTIDVRAKTANRRALGFYEKNGFLRAETDGDEIRLERKLD